MSATVAYAARLALLAVGLAGITVNTARYAAMAGRCIHGGKPSARYAVGRLAEVLVHNMLYRENTVHLLTLILFHTVTFTLALSHLNLYLKALTSPDSTPPQTPELWKAVLAASMAVLGVALLALRVTRWRRGLARLTPGILGLHALAQCIAWSWAAAHYTASRTALEAALLSTEAFHAYMATWAGYHGIAFLVRLYYTAKLLRQPPTITLGSKHG